MKISLSVETYKGVDGSSLSATRCHQIVSIYEMLESMGDSLTNYVGVQEEADNRKVFGSTNAKSAIRTFFPLLKKLGFVNYDGVFSANKCFTDTGVKFVLASRASFLVDDNTPNRDDVLKTLESIKANSIKQGLVNMRSNTNYNEHNIWIALKLFKVFGNIDWNAFLYVLHCHEIGQDIEFAIDEIKTKESEINDIEFTNEKGEPLPNTCYSYIRSLLMEAGLIVNVSSRQSKVTEDAKFFFSQIQL